mmetsp:Transcript_57900/g.154304  ORF Transcript_57900/g.154304 Transcript_57900/m.154304 type:complete len:112 (-) Transcript_57900:9-344(-)
MSFVVRFCRGKMPHGEGVPSPSTASVEVSKLTHVPGRTDTSSKHIPIDSMTTVPEDLYVELVNAGKEARQRGQHRLATRQNTRSSPLRVRSSVCYLVSNEPEFSCNFPHAS